MKTLVILAAATCFPVLLVAQAGPTAFDIQPGWSASSRGYVYQPEGQAGPVLGKPFSAQEVRHTTQILNDGTRVNRVEKGRFYRDTQGRMRIESVGLWGTPDLIVVFDPDSGVVTEINPQQRTYSKAGSTDAGGSAYIAVGPSGSFVALADRGNKLSVRAAGPQSLKEDLPPTVINGTRVRGSRITSTIPVGAFGNERELKVITERWYSDDLQVMVKSFNSDPRFGVTTYELTNIVQTPPNPALFQIPADYVAK